jgi:hypothetical protein
VRADGLSDDPLGGVLDEGIDAEPFDEESVAAARGGGVGYPYDSDPPDLLPEAHPAPN